MAVHSGVFFSLTLSLFFFRYLGARKGPWMECANVLGRTNKKGKNGVEKEEGGAGELKKITECLNVYPSAFINKFGYACPFAFKLTLPLEWSRNTFSCVCPYLPCGIYKMNDPEICRLLLFFKNATKTVRYFHQKKIQINFIILVFYNFFKSVNSTSKKKVILFKIKVYIKNDEK